MSPQKYDAILILGGGINVDGSLNLLAQLQVQEAVKAFELYSAQGFITSGLHGYKGQQKPIISEARAYARYAEQLGIDPRAIYIEERSQETLGNILFTKMDILIPHHWTHVLVLPQANHSTERINYLLQKVLGPGYKWTVIRPNINVDEKNVAREKISLHLTKQINDAFKDGDHDAIYKGLLASHPAYGGTMWTVDELRERLS